MDLGGQLEVARVGRVLVAEIVEPDTQQPVPWDAESSGELQCRGNWIAADYYDDPRSGESFTTDGWLRTGDLARADDEGFVYIVDRWKDMYISGGENVYPAEIEAVLYKHPAVHMCAVVGVPHETWGEVGKAIVELKPGASLSLETLSFFLKDRLGKFKLPKYLKVVDSIPRTPASAKVQKFLLKEKHGGANND